ncbi:nucleotidyltransferase family protein [Actinidia rufa]|uniref:Nucleotidyltransferase family protein n=1 Tax=Actinidia rufa TaxID=165716 RepID=A0A7J0GW12_9ERIC|nr:nucleotidyltransferase family protein [Actinidia rufa]
MLCLGNSAVILTHRSCMQVKEWAKAHGINDPRSGSLNSYCLSLLIIFHFQLGVFSNASYTGKILRALKGTRLLKTCVPALLPPLKEIYPGNLVDDLTETHIEETCAENITNLRSDRSRTRNQSSLSELFISFLAKVEDPFEQPANTARTVSIRQLTNISQAFRTTHQMLTSGNQNQSSAIATLVRPQVSQLFPRTPINPNAFTSGNGRARPQMHRAVHSPSQVQHRIHNTRVDRRPNNGTMHRAVNASPSQGQQSWRPRYDG